MKVLLIFSLFITLNLPISFSFQAFTFFKNKYNVIKYANRYSDSWTALKVPVQHDLASANSDYNGEPAYTAFTPKSSLLTESVEYFNLNSGPSSARDDSIAATEPNSIRSLPLFLLGKY